MITFDRLRTGLRETALFGIPLRHILLTGAVAAALCAVPLIRTAGTKGVTLLTLVVSLMVPLMSLGDKAPRRRMGRDLAAFLGLAALPYLVVFAVALATTSSCELGDGALTFLVSSLPGLILAYAVADLIRSQLTQLRRMIFAAIWIALAIEAGYWFLTEPVYRIAHPLVGMLLGPPNELQDPIAPRVLWFGVERLMVAWSLVSAAAIARAGWLTASWHRYAELGIVGGLAISLIGHSADLGYRIDRAYIVEEVLPVREASHGIVHRMSPRLPTDVRPWLMVEAEFQRHRQAQFLQLDDDELPPATIFWFRDRSQKREFTGASHTKFAKVHLGEVYVSADSFPPHTVGHELCHVTSGLYSHTLLRVPGRLGGLWYNPALVEGFAVAVAWTDFPLSAHEQARVALDKHRLPALEALFSPSGFVSVNLSVAYKASGSFLRYCFDTYGVDVVTTWYDSEDFQGAFGRPLHEVEADWHEMLRGLTVAPRDETNINRVQSRPSIGGERCGPADVDLRLREAMDDNADDEVDRLMDLLEAVDDDGTLWYQREKYLAKRSGYHREIPNAPAHKLSHRDGAAYEHLRALSLWARGQRREASVALATLEASKLSTDDVILARILIRDGYSIEDYRSPKTVDAATRQAMIWQRDRHPVFGYRIARRLWKKQRWKTLAAVLGELDWTGFEFPDGVSGRILLVTAQMRGLAAFANRDWDRAVEAFETYVAEADTEGRRSYGDRWRQRSAYFKGQSDRLVAALPPI